VKIKFITISLSTAILYTGCVTPPAPTVEHKEQSISSIRTKELDKIAELAQKLELSNKQPIYLYVESDGAVNESGTGTGELPVVMQRQLKSILMDFGSKVKVVDSAETLIHLYNSDPNGLTNRIFSINGAITMYDKNIMTQSSGFDFGIDFGKGSGETTSSSDFKDKDGLSILGMDFYFKRVDDIIAYKTSSKIDIKDTTRGYSFGISINNGGIGASAFKSIKDGVGLSVRKLLQESMYDLVSKAFNEQ
jgi:hypothetical protein